VPRGRDHDARDRRLNDSSPKRPDLDEAVDAWANMGDATPLRSVAAILVGFAVLTFGSVAAGRALIAVTDIGPGDPVTTTFLSWSLGSRLAIAALAGYLTAKTAPKAPLLHGAAFAGALVFISLAALSGQAAAGGMQDRGWFPRVMSLVGPVGVLAGAGLHRMRDRGR